MCERGKKFTVGGLEATDYLRLLQETDYLYWENYFLVHCEGISRLQLTNLLPPYTIIHKYCYSAVPQNPKLYYSSPHALLSTWS